MCVSLPISYQFQGEDVQVPAKFDLIWYSGRPWSWTRCHWSIADCVTTTLLDLKCVAHLCIYILHFLTNVLIEITYLPGEVLNQESITGGPRTHPLRHSDRRRGYIFGYISYTSPTAWKKKPANIAGSNPTLHYCKHHPAVRTAPPTYHTLGCGNQQICKLQTASSDLFIYTQCLLIGFCSL